MRYYRCKCGHREAWSTMGVPSCDVCEKCGSTLAEGPNLHLQPTHHRLETRYDQVTGEPYTVCRNCGKKWVVLSDHGRV